MRKFSICGLCNSLVDVLVTVEDRDLRSLDLEKATMRLVDSQEQEKLVAYVNDRPRTLVSGGSVANSVIACAQLGAPSALLCSLGDDALGRFYKQECESLGVAVPNALDADAATGTCLSLITPDAERTMRTNLGAAIALSEKHVSAETVRSSEWVFIEGYVLLNGQAGHGAVERILDDAAASDTKVAFTISESFVYELQGRFADRVIERSDLIFSNASEACAVSGKNSAEEAFSSLSERCRGIVITAGPDGAYFSINGNKGRVDAFPCTPIDLTGAGDMFAGAFLYGISHDVPPEIAARKACFLSAQVICRRGARIQEGLRDLWEQG